MSKNESSTQKDLLEIIFRYTAMFFYIYLLDSSFGLRNIVSFVKVIIMIFIALDKLKNSTIGRLAYILSLVVD